MGLQELLILAVFIGLPLWGIIDALSRPAGHWQLVRRNKVIWVLVQVFLGVLGALLYFATPRRELIRAAAGKHDAA